MGISLDALSDSVTVTQQIILSQNSESILWFYYSVRLGQDSSAEKRPRNVMSVPHFKDNVEIVTIIYK